MSFLSRHLVGSTPYDGIIFVGYKYVTSISSTVNIDVGSGLTGGASSTLQAGDFAVVAAVLCQVSSIYQDIAYSSGTGWTEDSALTVTDTQRCSMSVCYKYFTTTANSSVTFSKSSRADAGAIALAMVYRGVNSSTPLDVISTTATGANSVLANPPSITPTTDRSLVLGIGGGAHLSNLDTFSSSDLVRDFVSQGYANTYDGGSGDPTVGIGGINWNTGDGAIDPAAFSFSGSNSSTNSWCAATMALRPA